MGRTDPRVSCQWCIERLADLGERRVRDVYDVGNPAKPQMGHEMYFATDGRTALCIAPRLIAEATR